MIWTTITLDREVTHHKTHPTPEDARAELLAMFPGQSRPGNWKKDAAGPQSLVFAGGGQLRFGSQQNQGAASLIANVEVYGWGKTPADLKKAGYTEGETPDPGSFTPRALVLTFPRAEAVGGVDHEGKPTPPVPDEAPGLSLVVLL